MSGLPSAPDTFASSDAPAGAGPPAAGLRLPARLTVGAMLLLATWLIFLIRYHDPIVPYLIAAILPASLWRFRAGVVCLIASLATLALTLLARPSGPDRAGLDELLELTLLGLVCLGVRALLDGMERQRRTERRLITDLSTAVAQLRESERQQARAAQALAESNHLLRAILDAVDNGICLVDPAGRIGFANERLAKLLELDLSAILGQEAGAAVLAPDSLPAAAASGSHGVRHPGGAFHRDDSGAGSGRAALDDGPAEGSHRLIEVRRPACRLLSQFNTPVRDDAGALLGSLYVYSDLPDRYRLQELLEERVAARTRELQAAQAQLLRAERLAALGQFSATMAHELRNPLNIIKLSVHFLTGHVPAREEKLQRHLGHLHRAVERACAIIDDLLTFSRLPPPRLGPVAVNELVRTAVGALAAPEGARVEWSLAADLPPVLADARQIEQAIGNLVQNAFQAMPEGGCLTVATRPSDGPVEITLRDTGPGIPAELQERVFEPFFSTKATGTGLGLPLVREIALAHGGQLSLSSGPGEGACFTLALPAADSALPHPDPAPLPALCPEEEESEVTSEAGRLRD